MFGPGFLNVFDNLSFGGLIDVSDKVIFFLFFNLNQIYAFRYSLLLILFNFYLIYFQMWKVKKAFRLEIEWQNRLLPRIVVGQSRNKEEAETEQYDSLSMKYLSYVLYPLCIVGAIYSLLYTSHRRYANYVYFYHF